MQAMINTAWISFDPMTMGKSFQGPWDYMVKAALAPNNPRVVLVKQSLK
jgi:hypothetical protein